MEEGLSSVLHIWSLRYSIRYVGDYIEKAEGTGPQRTGRLEATG